VARDSTDTRERILRAADDLFYGEGIRAAGMDAIAAKAGVTKRTLYYHFRSKDHLIAAYLAARDAPTLARFTRWVEEADGSLAEQVASMFRRTARLGADGRWKGCGFQRAAAELAGAPGHPAFAVASAHKRRLEAWLAGRIAAAGLPEPSLRARQLIVLLDGAVAQMLIHRDPAYAEAAAAAADALLRPPSA
jgi:AcrR family transcriptional regulator